MPKIKIKNSNIMYLLITVTLFDNVFLFNFFALCPKSTFQNHDDKIETNILIVNKKTRLLTQLQRN